MVHLSVTKRIFELLDTELTSDVVVGCLSPDAIHMREESNRQDKNRTHVKHKDFSTLEEAILCLEKHFCNAKNGFDLGYFIHCVTDYLWYYHVYIDFVEQFEATTPSQSIKDIYYGETDYIDLVIFIHAPWKDYLWSLLSQTSKTFCNEFVTFEEVNLWILRTLHWFDDKKITDYTVPKFITVSIAETFIEESAKTIADILIRQNRISFDEIR